MDVVYICMIIFIVALIVGLVMEHKYDSEYSWVPYLVGVLSFIVGLADGDLKEMLSILFGTVIAILVLFVILYVCLSSRRNC